MVRNRRILQLCLFAAAACLSHSARADGNNYYIDESTDFTGNGCSNDDLNTVTSSLRTQLNNDGWTGSRFVNANAWPQDLTETCSSQYGAGGLDSSFGDTSTLIVYAGHGNKGLLQYGFKRDNKCIVNFQSTLGSGDLIMRLGSMSGNKAGYGVYVTSCTLHTSSLVSKANWQWLNQQFGYHNSPSVKDDQPRFWWNSIHRTIPGTTAKQAWLDEMEDKPGLFTGDNSPIVVSYGINSDFCNDMHNHSYLGEPGGIYWSRDGGPSCLQNQPAFHFCFTLRDNGDDGC
jgi:hypothetical protein